jgi:mono/diheme cytochrome c family protein
MVATAGLALAWGLSSGLAQDPASPAPASPGRTAAVTFTKEIAPLVFKNCAQCHRPGEVAPFPLLSYADVQKRAKTILAVVEKRLMPPWKPEPGVGEFHDARRLSDSEIALFKRWVGDGTPEGDLADLPPAPKFSDGWQLGEPDLVVKMAKPFTVPAEGRDVFRCFVIPLDQTEDKQVSAVEFRPGNRKVVHHALFFLDTSGRARQLEAKEEEPGYPSVGGVGFLPSGGLGGWAPGAFPRFLPKGIARPLRKGSDLVLQLHLHPTGKREVEQSTLGIYFSKEPAKRLTFGFPIASRAIDIPPGEKAYVVKSSWTLPADVEAIGVTPHAHYLCKEMKANATLPDGTTRGLIWIKDWDFNWQGQYQYKEAIPLPKGTRVSFEYTYDNSDGNPRNPSSPPKRVTFGEETTNEMAFLFLMIVPQRATDLPALRLEALRAATQGR